MMYRLIACDIDETLYEAGKIAPENIAAIDAFIKQGGRFVLATGRPGFTLEPMLRQLHLWQNPDEYLLVNNGALILSCADLHCVKKSAMSFDLARELFAFGQQFSVCIQVFSEDTLYIYRINDDEKMRLEYFEATHYQEIESFDALAGVEIIKMMYQNNDMDYLYEIEKQMPKEWKDALSLSYSSNRYMELNDRSIDKGKALAQLAELLHIAREDIIAIGDNANDASMIAYAGLGVCVANGQEAVKQVADHITKKDALHGAVAEVIWEFALPAKKEVQLVCCETNAQIKALAKLADGIWHEYFVALLSADQIDYMVDRFQSETALHKAIKQEAYQYWIAYLGKEAICYLGVCPKADTLFLSKLYLKKAYRGKGYANMMLKQAEQAAKKYDLPSITLTCNKYNTHSLDVYRHKGFVICDAVVSDIGNGYVMDDYILTKSLKK